MPAEPAAAAPAGAGAGSDELPDIVLVRGALRPADEDNPPLDATTTPTGSDNPVLDGAAALILPLHPGAAPGQVALDSATAEAAERYGLDLPELAGRLRLRGTAAEAAVVTLPRVLPPHPRPPWSGLPERLVLLGVGGGGPTDLRRAGAALGRACDRLERAVLVLPTVATDGDAPRRDPEPTGQGSRPPAETHGAAGPAEALRALAEGFLLAAYRPPRTGLGEGPPAPLARLVVLAREGGDADLEAALQAARGAARATWTARRLSAVPSNIKSPAWFAEQAALAVADAPGSSIRVHDEGWLAEHRFGGVLAVGSGSQHGPRLVVVEYRPRRQPGARHVVLVGKGITFDTGGLSLKGREAMIPMKTDMAGAAAVLAAVLGAAHAGLAHRVTAVLPLAENALGGASYRPGDVLTMQDGTTVEVLNTDAEGRLVLADSLAWASAALDPDVLVDVATLTGAASLGLGKRHAALYATDEPLADGLARAAAATGERTWRMPLVADYEDALHSAVADIANAATDPQVRGGSITAALFLRRFTRDLPWAHLDIAGPARAPKTEHEVSEGPSGFGARLLLRWLTDLPVDAVVSSG